jgi:hypothetical protein
MSRGHKGGRRKIHKRGCPTLTTWGDKSQCTCPRAGGYVTKRPESKAWDTVNTQPDVGLSTGVDGCYVQPIRKLYDKE